MRYLLPLLILASTAHAYVDLAPTLSRVIRDANSIALVEVSAFNAEKQGLILRKVRDLKGTSPDEFKHQVAGRQGTPIPRHILEWADPGQRAVLFTSPRATLVCIGQGWYQVFASADGWFSLGVERPELPLAYYGTVSRLTEAVELIVAGKQGIITTVPHGADNEGASFDLALNRAALPALVKVQRMRADLAMPTIAMAASANPMYLIGPGPAGQDDLPELIKRLGAEDPVTRAEAAEDIRCMNSKASAAAPALTKLLDDPAPRVRSTAAATLLQIDRANATALKVLADGLASGDANARRHAARALGFAGPAATPLVPKLTGLLGDPDERVRLSALQSIATLGPAAASAHEAVTRLLDEPRTAIDAADALGRIGAAARPALPRLAKMLESEAYTFRWAAVRAMSQIGGEEAAPAVKYMVSQMRGASDIDAYNMLVYLALLGPVAKDAIADIESMRIRNPVLRPATLWAIEPDKRMPWANDRFGGGMMREADFAKFIFEAYVAELGDRLKPAAAALARKMMDGSAGDVPSWSYALLSRFPDEVMPVLAPALAGGDIVPRERAAVALGYMGRSAASAAPAIKSAMEKAPTEREQRLHQWALRQVTK